MGRYAKELTKSIIQVKNKLKIASLKLKYEQICLLYKDIAKNLVHKIKFFKFLVKDQQLHKQNVWECLNYIKSILNSTEFIKYGHRLPLFSELLRKYQQQFCTKSNNSFQAQQIIQQKILLNEQSKCYNLLKPITQIQSKFINTQIVQQTFDKVNSGETIIFDSNCVCCARVFTKGFQIENKNPLFSVVRHFNKKSKIQFSNIQKELCAICNFGGGVLIIGAQRENNALKAEGIRYQNMEQIIEKQSLIYNAAHSIQTQIDFVIERVLVHTNYVSHSNKVIEEYMRICFRVIVLPRNLKKINYLYFRPKGFPHTFEVYQIDKNMNTQRVLCKTEKQNQNNLYSFMHDKYRNEKLLINSHLNIACFRPHIQYSKIFINEGYPMLTNLDVRQIFEQQVQDTVLQEPLNMKYRHCSFLIVNNQQGDRNVNQFKLLLEHQKIPFTLQKPFSKTFNLGQRSVWLMSHQINFIELKQYLRSAVLKKVVKADTITLMPVYKNLQIQTSKISQQQFQIIKKRFLAKHNKIFSTKILDVFYQGKEPKNMLCYYFDNLNESIYSYMIFESLRLRPYFVKEANDPKKKLDY